MKRITPFLNVYVLPCFSISASKQSIKSKSYLCFALLLIILSINSIYAQNSPVEVTVKWRNDSFENRLELYNTTNDLLMTICDDTQCYVSTQEGVTDAYGAKYDLGCVTNGNNYYIKMYDIANDGWDSGLVSVVVAGVEVINNDGSTADTSGDIIYFNVSGGDATCNGLLDTDSDGVADYLDYDDDGDGITDAVENLGEDRFECSLPELSFENGSYDAAASTSAEGTVGSVYRFGNAIQGFDVLMEITELTDATIANIDNDTIDNPTYLQTELNLGAAGTPGATFKFTIVNAGTTTASTEIFRINGITWDCDGGGGLKESVIYYDAAAYGTENPTSLEITDLGSGNIQMSASGLQEGPGFSNLKVLRAYYQFIGNTFTMRMQAIKTYDAISKRQFGMSFTQCEFLDFNANSLVIVRGEDFDGDGKYNHLDLDSDNDGIPDNVEGQTTLGYIAPSLTVDASTGIDLVYGSGIDVVNSDNDKTPDILDLNSDNDAFLDIEENGMADAIAVFSDSDNDGLDVLFEGTLTNDPLDVNDDINTPQASILPDDDGDVLTGGDVDYRDLFNTNPPVDAFVDFDGVDDYLSIDRFIEGQDQVTIMAWVKADSGSSGIKTIAGEERGCRLWLQTGNKPTFTITTNGNSTKSVGANAISYDEWHHITGVYSNTTGIMLIYVDGKLQATRDTGETGSPIESTAVNNGAFEVGRYSADAVDNFYFDGAIDEVRVFDIELTEDQIQRMVYQEIHNNANFVCGSVIAKDIRDITTDATIPWSNLIAYYPMTNIKSNRTADASSNNHNLVLNNITTVQAQTAPMPYESDKNGDWATENTWLHGDVWDIEDVNSNKDWSIVRINSNVSTSSSHTQLGMIIEEGENLTVSTDKFINNTWYLELKGTLDLQDDSQLLQTEHSDLVTSVNGKILRRQSSASSMYWYTYLSSPVGQLRATTIGNDNADTNNINNSPFSLNMLKEGNGDAVEFTTANHEVGKLSTRWTYTFQNGIDYFAWLFLDPTTTISPGVGYIQKGMGNAGTSQEFIFEGRPNNGTIKIAADDVDGDSANESEVDVTQTTTLIGNPYPSAIDAHQFIDDNQGVIDGTLYFWHQWAGTSHNLDLYEGGYAVVNKMAKVRAYQFVGISGDDNGSQDGTLTPTRYIAVGQSFFTEVIEDGEIEFNNNQRVFKREANGESQFFKNASTTNEEETEEEDIQIVTLEFRTSNDLSREIVLGFSDFTSEDFDYGYDGKMFGTNANDIYTTLGDEKMITQAYGAITEDKEVPLHLSTSGEFTYSISATSFTGFEETQEVYLKDAYTNTYFDLRSDQVYNFTSESGEFNDRFFIVFSTEDSLSTEENALAATVIYFNAASNKLFAKGFNNDFKTVRVINLLGQEIMSLNNVAAQTLENGINITNASSGVYIVSLTTENNLTLDKKIIIN